MVDELADHISEEVVRVWRMLVEINNADLEDRWEHDDPPGRRREFLDATNDLAALLGIGPHQENPFDVDDPTPPDYYTDWQRGFWLEAWDVRCQIEHAVAAAK